MHEEHKKIIIKSIQDTFNLKEKYHDYEINSYFQLFLTQLDLFKTISALVIGIIGIGYFFSNYFNGIFLLLSLIFSLITLFGTISYTREIIDLEAKQIKEQGKIFKRELDEAINISVEAINKDDPKIYFDFAEQKLKLVPVREKLVYAGEIFTFFFFNSLIFGLLAFFIRNLNLGLILNLVLIMCVLLLVYLVSFRNWSVKIITFFSREI